MAQHKARNGNVKNGICERQIGGNSRHYLPHAVPPRYTKHFDRGIDAYDYRLWIGNSSGVKCCKSGAGSDIENRGRRSNIDCRHQITSGLFEEARAGNAIMTLGR